MMKRTKIICTLGPAVDSESALKNLVLAGMDVARCNFSHGSRAEHKARMDRLKKVRRELDAPCALMLDTKGPSIRTGKLEGNEPVLLRAGDNFFLTEDDIAGTSRRVHQTFKGLYKYVEPGTIILIDDGLIELAVDRILGSDIQCTVQNSGMLGECKQLNLPGTNVPLPVMTKQDKEDLLFGIQQGVDFVAASFVSCGEDVRAIRAFLAENGGESIRIVAKIENAHAVDHIEEIIEVSDAVMVARGDLGVEVPSNQVPHLQKKIIKACNRAYRPVITATQMLDSMIRNPAQRAQRLPTWQTPSTTEPMPLPFPAKLPSVCIQFPQYKPWHALPRQANRISTTKAPSPTATQSRRAFPLLWAWLP